MRAGITVVNGTQFFKFESAQAGQQHLHFQPGDVIGWYLHTLVQSIDNALTVVYEQSTDLAVPPVDMYRIPVDDRFGRANARPPCQVCIRSEQASLISSVIPFVNVDYGMYM